MSAAPDHDLLVLYATETGTARDAADRAARHLRRLHLRPRVVSVDAYPLAELIHEPLVLFLLASAGSGAFPRPAHALWHTLLRADLPPDLFDDLAFAVFGLGDSAYEKFCWPAKLLQRRLEGLGGRALLGRGEGDEQHVLGIDGALLPWLDSLANVLAEHLALPPPSADDAPRPPRVAFVPAPPRSSASRDPRLADARYHAATLRVNKRITADDWWQDVRHLEFDFDDDVDYRPGDVASILPQNPPDAVAAFLDALGWTDGADDPVYVQPTLGDQTLPPSLFPPSSPAQPPTTTLRALLTTHLSLSSVPRRAFWEALLPFLADEMERDKVREWLGPEGADDLHAYTTAPRRTTLEALSEFRSARGRVPREHALELLQPMREREFSVAGSVKNHPRQLHLCVAIVRYRTKLKIPRRGIATSYLAGLQPGTRLLIGLKRGQLELPPARTPLICVGPGTGVAPMRAVVEERVRMGAGDTTLYFGCRAAGKDQHYAEEWRAYAREGRVRYRLAASRDPLGVDGGEESGEKGVGGENRVGGENGENGVGGDENGKVNGDNGERGEGKEGAARGKTYVQDLIAQDAKEVWSALRRGGCVFISGSSNKMPASVRAALRTIAREQGGLGEAGAGAWVEGMEREGRLVEECWG